MIGQGVALAAMPLLAASITRDPLQVSLVTVASYSASLIMGLPAGALVDRWPLRGSMIGADLARCLLLVTLALAILGSLTSLPMITLAAFGLAVGACFFDPAAQAMIPALVTRDARMLARANGAVWTLDTIGRALLGPPLGALLFSVAAFAPFALNAVTFLASAILLLKTPRAQAVARERPALWAEVKQGVSFVVHNARLRWLATGMGVYNFGYNVAFSTLVLFAQDRLHVSDAGYGLLLATLALGGVLGGWASRHLPPEVAPRVMYGVAMLLQAAGWALVVSGQLLVAGAGLAVVGAASTALSALGGTARQLATPEGMIGRATAATRTVGIGAAAVGGLVGGVVGLGGIWVPLVAAAAAMVLAALAFLVGERRSR
ncbi:MAG: MFS transporter [Humibacillus sp.]|nr:MFS transporter [Humibacillus sp.]MDN5778753.1 MFS transporter [Humibacillus sp.]